MYSPCDERGKSPRQSERIRNVEIANLREKESVARTPFHSTVCTCVEKLSRPAYPACAVCLSGWPLERDCVIE